MLLLRLLVWLLLLRLVPAGRLTASLLEGFDSLHEGPVRALSELQETLLKVSPLKVSPFYDFRDCHPFLTLFPPVSASQRMRLTKARGSRASLMLRPSNILI